MEYCSLTDAFPELNTSATARKEEKKKAKRCKGPPLSFLESGDQAVVDPDRPALRPSPDVPPLNKETGLREHAPVDAEPFTDASSEQQMQQLLSQLQSQKANPEQQAILNTMPSVSTLQKGIKKPGFFGANFDDGVSEGFASFTNIIGDDPAYRLAPDFSNAFAGRGLNKATGSTTLPTPSVVDVWKPLTPTGARTSYFNKLPPPGGEVTAEEPTPSAHKEEFFKKLDRIYARLDDLESRHSENSQTEVLLFIMSGIFVLFSMDLLVRKTGNVRIMTR
jgi:hypothetical protein